MDCAIIVSGFGVRAGELSMAFAEVNVGLLEGFPSHVIVPRSQSWNSVFRVLYLPVDSSYKALSYAVYGTATCFTLNPL
jgi:hypothetical protein